MDFGSKYRFDEISGEIWQEIGHKWIKLEETEGLLTKKNKGIQSKAKYNPNRREWEYEEFEKIKVKGKLDEIRVKKKSKSLKRKPDKLKYLAHLDYGIPIDLDKKINDFRKELEENAEKILEAVLKGE